MNKKRFTDKICLVSGGSSGIGKATSLQLAREGGKVVIMNRNEEEGKEVVAEIKAAGGEAIFIKTDVGIFADVRAAVQETLDTWGKIDVLINNAAMMTFKPITEISEEEWEKLMAVNLGGMFMLCKHCIPHIQGGAIVNVSSVHAHQTTGKVAPYAASKGAIEAFTRALSQEIPIQKLRINSVAPGAVDTPMLWSNPNVQNGTEKVEGAVGKPEDLAEAICFLASDEAKFINGTTLVVDGGRLAEL